MKQKNNSIPKIIWVFWEQGWDKAPKLVQGCLRSWQHHNKNWEIRCLDKHSTLDFFDIEQWMPGAELKPKLLVPVKKWLHKMLHSSQLVKTKKVRIQHRSDVIRTLLLEQYGGVWVDATLFCRKPLDDWITPHTTHNFFAFSNPGMRLALMDKSLPLFMNYFLISTKGSYIIQALSRALYQYWQQHDRANQYLFMHALFNDCYANDKKFQQIWDLIIKIDAPIPPTNSFDETGGIEFFAWQTPEQLNDLSPAYKKMINDNATPVLKLSHKKEYSPDESLRINYLFSTIDANK